MVECWICGKSYEPNPEKVKAWAESGENFDGMDWECPECIAYESPEPEILEADQTPYCDEGKHEFKEEYYGCRCVHCGLFYPDCMGPWMPFEESD